jgi:hypothetical protein
MPAARCRMMMWRRGCAHGTNRMNCPLLYAASSLDGTRAKPSRIGSYVKRWSPGRAAGSPNLRRVARPLWAIRSYLAEAQLRPPREQENSEDRQARQPGTQNRGGGGLEWVGLAGYGACDAVTHWVIAVTSDNV